MLFAHDLHYYMLTGLSGYALLTFNVPCFTFFIVSLIVHFGNRNQTMHWQKNGKSFVLMLSYVVLVICGLAIVRQLHPQLTINSLGDLPFSSQMTFWVTLSNFFAFFNQWKYLETKFDFLD